MSRWMGPFLGRPVLSRGGGGSAGLRSPTPLKAGAPILLACAHWDFPGVPGGDPSSLLQLRAAPPSQPGPGSSDSGLRRRFPHPRLLVISTVAEQSRHEGLCPANEETEARRCSAFGPRSPRIPSRAWVRILQTLCSRLEAAVPALCSAPSWSLHARLLFSWGSRSKRVFFSLLENMPVPIISAIIQFLSKFFESFDTLSIRNLHKTGEDFAPRHVVLNPLVHRAPHRWPCTSLRRMPGLVV